MTNPLKADGKFKKNIEVFLTKEDIDKGVCRSRTECALAQMIKREIQGAENILVDEREVRFSLKENERRAYYFIRGYSAARAVRNNDSDIPEIRESTEPQTIYLKLGSTRPFGSKARFLKTPRKTYAETGRTRRVVTKTKDRDNGL
jgi:hypothetical protein